MKKLHIILAAAIATASLVPITFWLSGFDFDHRGSTAVMCFLFTLALGVLGAMIVRLLQD